MEVSVVTIEKRNFAKTRKGEEAHIYRCVEENGIGFEISDFGATLLGVFVPDKDGDIVDVVLGYDDLEVYEKHVQCMGATIGRTCNRIENAAFRIDDKKYKLSSCFGPHHIHGGREGFHKKMWEASELPNGVRLKYVSPDMEEGYPGTLGLEVDFTIEDGNTLQIEYNAYTDKDTLCSITNHAYFNLNGTGNGNVLNHTLTIYSDEFTKSNKYCFPNGNILSVEGTPLDFREGKRIGQDILSDYEQVKWYGGYDNNFVIRDYNGDDVPKKVARVVGDKSGIILTCESTLPGVQLYTANSIEGTIGKKGYRMNNYDGFCLEAQYFPNAMAHNNFVQPILRAGDKYHHITRYTFTR